MTDGSEPVTDDTGPVDTYLDERINIPDADNVRMRTRDCVLEFFYLLSFNNLLWLFYILLHRFFILSARIL